MQGFLAEGLQRTSAGLGSVIIDSQPLTVALLASVFFGESLSALGYGGEHSCTTAGVPPARHCHCCSCTCVLTDPAPALSS